MVYVDDMYLHPMGKFGRMKMSHMIADTRQELIEMAEKIGVKSKWIQNKGTYLEHFDISMGSREKAIKLGAKSITMRELLSMAKEREYSSPLTYLFNVSGQDKTEGE